jgi:hypothetical protein
MIRPKNLREKGKERQTEKERVWLCVSVCESEKEKGKERQTE